VNNVTKGPIEQANQEKVKQALAKVLPEGYDNDPIADQYKVADGKDTVYFFPAKKNGQLLGTAVKSFTQKGFSGYIGIMVGILPDGTIKNTEVLQQNETPGLGTLMLDAKFKDQFNGKKSGEFNLTVKKDGGDVDAITAATISSRAYCDAIQRAIDLLAKQSPTGDTSVQAPTDTCIIKDIDPIKEVLPAFDNDPLIDTVTVNGLKLFIGRSKTNLSGVAVKAFAKGYNENIWILVGFLPDGTIHQIKVLRHKESKGKGSQVCDPSFLEQFIGKNPEKFTIKTTENGGNVDGVSSCTVTVNALCTAVQSAYDAFKKGGLK
jgi:electron transport complex protein RnfG